MYATQTPGPYWIHVKGLTTCTPARVYGLGILQYEGAENKPLSADPGYEGFQVTNPRVSQLLHNDCNGAVVAGASIRPEFIRSSGGALIH